MYKHVITKLQTNHQRDQNLKLHIFLKTGIVCQFLSKKKRCNSDKILRILSPSYCSIISAVKFRRLAGIHRLIVFGL